MKKEFKAIYSSKFKAWLVHYGDDYASIASKDPRKAIEVAKEWESDIIEMIKDNRGYLLTQAQHHHALEYEKQGVHIC